MAFETNLRDLRFVLFEQLDLSRLFETERYSESSRDLTEMVLSEADKFAKGVLAPLNKKGDEVGAHFADSHVTLPDGFKDAWLRVAEGGWLGVAGNPQYTGQGLPVTLKASVDDLFFSANTSLSLTNSLATASACVIDDFGGEEMKALYLKKIYSGQWAATMCLTEPGAGSALASVRTEAVKIEGTKDRYRITGNKIFITMGEHDLTENIVHLVLARVPGAPSGTRGISLFIVPKFKVQSDGSMGPHNDVTCTRIEHKMGIKASATCQLSFGDAGTCEGQLIGEENKGLMYMFRMMNEERIMVGIQGVALASAAYLYALRYCEERLQGPSWRRRKDRAAPNVAIIDHPDIRRMLLWQKSHVEGMRSLLLTTAYYADLSYSSADEQERLKCNGFVELLTPICKAFCTDRGFESTILAIQCLGGYGFTSEYDAEQYARDAKIGSIYEGTNFIQAQDFLTRKIPMAKGEIFASYLKIIQNDLDEIEKSPELAHFAALTKEALEVFTKAVRHLMEIERNEEMGFYALLHAADAVQMMGDICVSHLLLNQALIALKALHKAGAATAEAQARLATDDAEIKFYLGKVKAASFYTTQILPNVFAKAKAVHSGDASILDPVF